jgi:hypothetical protein
MTRQKSLKREVRARMAKTGERYTAARRHVVQHNPESPPPALAPDMPVADASLRQKTGRGWDEWLSVLDEWGTTTRTHSETARWLMEDHGVDGWWAQSVTVGYERARGLRAKHQTSGGFSVGATRTVGATAERASSAFTEPALRAQWLGDAAIRERTSRQGRSARFDWLADGSRVVVDFDAKGPAKTTISVQHERLPDAASAEAMKSYWRERLRVLKELLESAPYRVTPRRSAGAGYPTTEDVPIPRAAARDDTPSGTLIAPAIKPVAGPQRPAVFCPACRSSSVGHSSAKPNLLHSAAVKPLVSELRTMSSSSLLSMA